MLIHIEDQILLYSVDPTNELWNYINDLLCVAIGERYITGKQAGDLVCRLVEAV